MSNGLSCRASVTMCWVPTAWSMSCATSNQAHGVAYVRCSASHARQHSTERGDGCLVVPNAHHASRNSLIVSTWTPSCSSVTFASGVARVPAASPGRRADQHGDGVGVACGRGKRWLHATGLEELRAGGRVEPVLDVVDVVDCDDLHGGFPSLVAVPVIPGYLIAAPRRWDGASGQPPFQARLPPLPIGPG